MSEKIRILYVEDDPVDVDLMNEYLSDTENFKYELTTITELDNLKDKNDKISKFDIILLDLGLRFTHGIETYENYKKLDINLPVIIVTGLDDEEVGIQAISEGAQDYLVKGSFGGKEISRSIRYSLERFRVEQALKQSEQLYRDIFDAVSDGLIIHDPDGRILEVNPAAMKLYGYTREELFQLNIVDLITKENRKLIKDTLPLIKGDFVFKSESRDIRKDGSVFFASVVSRELFYQGKKRILIVIHDITSLKESKATIEKHRDELEIQVKKRTEELEEKYLELAHDYEVMIGREYRIKELRDEVKELKSKLLENRIEIE